MVDTDISIHQIGGRKLMPHTHKYGSTAKYKPHAHGKTAAPKKARMSKAPKKEKK
jgi:hypothetical protein